ncbi:FAD-dependent oxidoreductase [Jiella avicenniae]|uniref:FAD-dependent oxidoreductase n=1 Tax=Jiella avicenniae TaxID=2907202 RepID=A0A9X1P6F7_9HYPH|nr:FAD-dependent oxidoreductase [Jiella avicenniae]MCE7030629.1 FAD-dependent oxidoreductase [Jiella avicenniae]
MVSVERAEAADFETFVRLAIVGAGAAGLTAALAAREAGAEEVVILERDAAPSGSTALSAGLVPAAGTRFQKEAGIEDGPELFAADIMRKAHDEPDADLVQRVAAASGPTVEWLADRFDLPFSLVADFSYPGHARRRMHGMPSRSGQELVDRLRQAAEDRGCDILCDSLVETLFVGADGRVTGLAFARPDGAGERLGVGALILACNGYGGNPALVAEHIPELSQALYSGHQGNRGEAILWGAAMGAKLRHLSGHQGHGSLAHPAGILLTWATITEGGFQVNVRGERFSDESRGYSEQAAEVLKQPEGIAYTIFDERIAAICRQFEDFRNLEAIHAVVSAATIEELAEKLKLPAETLGKTMRAFEAAKGPRRADARAGGGSPLDRAPGEDRFGRKLAGTPRLEAPFRAARVTGALFHTQGGLVVDGKARVLRADGTAISNLYAAGGAACGVSGAAASGYLSGNGLLTAVTLGRIAGEAAGGEA